MNTPKEAVSFDAYLMETLDAIHQKAVLLSSYIIFASFIFGLAIAPIFATWQFAMGIGGVNLLLFWLATYRIHNKTIARQIISLIFAFFTLQFISQMHGMAALHFFYFIFALVLVMYQDWRMMLPYAMAFIFYHSFFFTLQIVGYTNLSAYFLHYVQVDYLVMGFYLGLTSLMALLAGIGSYYAQMQTKRVARVHHSQQKNLINLERGVNFAKEISTGKLDSPYELLSEDDFLGQALLQMRENLRKAQQKDHKERFINEGLNRINKVMQQNLNHERKLCDAIIREISDYMHINQAGVFIPHKELDHARLELLACYAYDRKKFLKKEILVGQYAEGIIGQVYLEKETVYIEEIPKGYLKIITGLGETEPKCLMIIPLLAQQEVVGIMELGALQKLEDYEREYLKRVAEGLAATLKSSQMSAQTRALLKASQEQAEELKAQEEEMRQNMEELMATQEAMRIRQKALEENNISIKEK